MLCHRTSQMLARNSSTASSVHPPFSRPGDLPSPAPQLLHATSSTKSTTRLSVFTPTNLDGPSIVTVAPLNRLPSDEKTCPCTTTCALSPALAASIRNKERLY